MLFALLLLPVLIFGLAALLVVLNYNSLVTLKNAAVAAWHQIDVQLNLRADLVDNLVETVRGYAAHERTVLDDVTRARSDLTGRKSAAEAGRALSGLEAALSRLFAVAENYPDLKADSSFLSLQAKLREIEGLIATARTNYNETVRRYNTACQRFPANLYAATFGFEPRNYVEVAEAKIEPPKVDFS